MREEDFCGAMCVWSRGIGAVQHLISCQLFIAVSKFLGQVRVDKGGVIRLVDFGFVYIEKCCLDRLLFRAFFAIDDYLGYTF